MFYTDRLAEGVGFETAVRLLPYLRTMFACCMLFQIIYVLCAVLWLAFPGRKGHILLLELFPQFKLLDLPSFAYGLVMSMKYGWAVAVIFVFFYNLWPRFTFFIFGSKLATQ